ncbi:MAG TPA: tetratricopeptide repeat protein [Pyrinomonadaceae bacterium]|nr:tetratricopeptide repeat protein [Pyrinomonadaceae bacterium]
MKPLRPDWKRQFLPIAFVATLAVSVSAQTSQLGSVQFQTSGSEKAQAHFLRGLAALHSFWYEEALEAFRESTKIEPDFMMGYWGEAMAHNHPLWSEQDSVAARQVIAKIKDNAKLTKREQAYLDAVKALYAEGVDSNKYRRDAAYSAVMEKIYREYPEDLDAAAFYSLSLLGLATPGDKGYRNQARAGAIALEVYEKNPNHPGAAHYIIHAFDDPEHAILALPAARRYADIAPEAHHARHMPSHIFLQLGMWPEAAASNESAWQSSDAWMKRKQLSASVRDYHSLHWLLYVYLQQGRYRKADELLTLMKKTMSESAYENKLRPGYYENNYANMAAAFVVETERWNLAAILFPAGSGGTDSTGDAGNGGGHGAHGAKAAVTSSGAVKDLIVRASNRSQTLPLFIRGLSAVRGDAAEVAKSLAGLRAIGADGAYNSTAKGMLEIRQLEIDALAASMKQDHDRAVELMKRATALEEAMPPPSGPPGLVKPSHELFGELLLKAGKPAEAAEQFKAAMLRQPNRARSLLGMARAAAAMGDTSGARSAYARLIEQWKEADEELAELREAREFLRKQK